MDISGSSNHNSSSGNLSVLAAHFSPMTEEEIWVQQFATARQLLTVAGQLLEDLQQSSAAAARGSGGHILPPSPAERERWKSHFQATCENRLLAIYVRLTTMGSPTLSETILDMQDKFHSLELLRYAKDLRENELKLFSTTLRSFEDAAGRCQENVRIMQQHRKSSSGLRSIAQDPYLKLHQMPLFAYQSAIVKLEHILEDLQEQIHGLELLLWKAHMAEQQQQQAQQPAPIPQQLQVQQRPPATTTSQAAVTPPAIATQELRHASSSQDIRHSSSSWSTEGGDHGAAGTPQKRHSPPTVRVQTTPTQSRLSEYSPQRPQINITKVTQDVRSLLMISDSDDAGDAKVKEAGKEESEPSPVASSATATASPPAVAPAVASSEWTTVATRAKPPKAAPATSRGLKLESLGSSQGSKSAEKKKSRVWGDAMDSSSSSEIGSTGGGSSARTG